MQQDGQVVNRHTPEQLKEIVFNYILATQGLATDASGRIDEAGQAVFVEARMNIAAITPELQTAFAQGLVEALQVIKRTHEGALISVRGQMQHELSAPATDAKAIGPNLIDFLPKEHQEFAKLVMDYIVMYKNWLDSGASDLKTDVMKLGFLSLELAAESIGSFCGELLENVMRTYNIREVLGLPE